MWSTFFSQPALVKEWFSTYINEFRKNQKLYMTQQIKDDSFFFLIDKQPNILEKAKKLHVYRGYTEKPKKRAEQIKDDSLYIYMQC